MNISTEFLIGLAVGLLIWALILTFIISNAVNANAMLKHAKAQTLLLADMAIQAGSDPVKVNKLLDDTMM